MVTCAKLDTPYASELPTPVDHDDGTYTATWTLKIPGRYCVTTRCQGYHITKSPRWIEVEESGLCK
jgi:hypothetical protein